MITADVGNALIPGLAAGKEASTGAAEVAAMEAGKTVPPTQIRCRQAGRNKAAKSGVTWSPEVDPLCGTQDVQRAEHAELHHITTKRRPQPRN